MSAFSRRITAGAGITLPENRRLNCQIGQSLTFRSHQNLLTNQKLRIRPVFVDINRLIEVSSDDGSDDWNWKGNRRTKLMKSFLCRVGEVDENVERDNRTVEVMVGVGATVVLGVANRVLYKLALVPLKHYPFFLAQLATFG